MHPLSVLTLALAVGLSAAAGSSPAPGRDPPNDIKNCERYPDVQDNDSSSSSDSSDSSSSSSSSSSSDSSSSSSSEEDSQHNGSCPEIDASQCSSGRLKQCGRCQACLVHLERGERCSFPWATNAECGPKYVCYTRGTCDYPVV